MGGKYVKKKKFPVIPFLLAAILVMALVVGALFLLPKMTGSNETTPAETEGTAPQAEETTVPPTTQEPTVPPTEPDRAVAATASFTVTGDLLMHKPVFQACWDSAANNWVFDSIFTYVSPYLQEADYAVANLETTLCGSGNGYAYSGMPLFNCPDGIAISSKNAGFDMLLTGNNHCYDTRMVGIRRTLKILDEVGLASLGTQNTKDDIDYKVVDVNGIKVGMLAYAAESKDGMPGVISINAIQCHPDSFGMISTFDYGQLEKFYNEVAGHMEAMKAEGAEAFVMYMHWGEEYQLEPTSLQKKMAQQLCDMGVDVIVGGHPHVIEPVDLLTATENENQKTLVIYSTGNAVSNQRIAEMRMKSGHTEDGILFNFTLVKYIDGTVEVLEASCTPTWVNMIGYQKGYVILPLDYSRVDSWQEDYQLDDSTYANCLASYDRTMALVGEGLEKAQAWFDAQHEAKSAVLNDPNWKPEPVTEPTEVTEPAETTLPTEVPGETAGETLAETQASTEPEGTEG